MPKSIARKELEQACRFEELGQFKRALSFYLKAAEHGSAEAQVNLGNLYDEGKGCRKNSPQAVRWYKQAVKAGAAEGAYNLGVHYQKVGQSRWAKFWFARGARMGDKDAQEALERYR